MSKKIRRLVCNVRVEHKTKAPLQFVPHQGERPLMNYQSPPPLDDEEQIAQLPQISGEKQPDPHEIDPYKVADRVYEIMLAQSRSIRLRGGR